MSGKQNPWQRKSRTRAYENPWIGVDHDEVITPGGSPGIYGVVRFKNIAVAAVPLDAAGNTVLVGQFRYALDRYSWEVPEGGCPQGEETSKCALRELKEETGLTAKHLTKLVDLDLSNSVTDEVGVAYLATELTAGEAEPEDTEDLALRTLPFSDAVRMALDGRITDALSIVALLAADAYLRDNPAFKPRIR